MGDRMLAMLAGAACMGLVCIALVALGWGVTLESPGESPPSQPETPPAVRPVPDEPAPAPVGDSGTGGMTEPDTDGPVVQCGVVGGISLAVPLSLWSEDDLRVAAAALRACIEGGGLGGAALTPALAAVEEALDAR